MKAIVLAAGRGSRLGPRTEEMPKCMVPLAGRPLLAWQRAALAAAGVQDLVVVRGYRPERLEGDGYAVLDNPRWAETNMVATLRCAGAHLREGPAIVSYADIVYHPDVVRRLADAPGDLVITYDWLWQRLWTERFEDPYSDAESFVARGGRLVTIGERSPPAGKVEGQYMGLLKFTPAGWSAVEALLGSLPTAEVDGLDMTSLLRRLVESGVEVRAVPVEGRWCEVDSESDLLLYQRRLQDVDAGWATWTHDWRWREAA